MNLVRCLDAKQLLTSDGIKMALKTVATIKRLTKAKEPDEAINTLLRGVPEDVKAQILGVLQVAKEVAKDPHKNPEDVARAVAEKLNIPSEQIEDFVSTVTSLAELVADVFVREEREKSI